MLQGEIAASDIRRSSPEPLVESLLSATFGDYFLPTPLAMASGCLGYEDYGSWQTLKTILSQEGVDVLTGREGQPLEGRAPCSGNDARELLKQGWTLGIRHAERHDSDLAALAKCLQQRVLAPVDIHLYCTPSDCTGFGWHYDAEDVFILQTAGTKNWELRKNTVNPWPLVDDLPRDMHYEREIMPVVRCKLAIGDWLYIPAGYWHRTVAEEESISLSIGILSPTAMMVLDFLKEYLKTSLMWRQRLPPSKNATPVDEAEQLVSYQTLCRQLGTDLSRVLCDEHFVRRLLEYRHSDFVTIV